MKPILRALTLFAVVLALIWATFGHANAGSIPLLGAGTSSAAAPPPGYAGPLDTIPVTAGGCWSVYACSAAAAAAGASAIDVVDQTNSNPLTVHVLTDGTLDKATVAAWVTAHSVTTIRIVQFYEQMGVAQNMGVDPGGGGPTTLDISGVPYAAIASSNNSYLRTLTTFTGWSGVNANSVSVVSNRTGSLSVDTGLVAGTGTFENNYVGGVAAVKMYAGATAVGNVAASDNTWHSITAVFNGASSILSVDGTSSTGNAGTTVPSGFLYFGVGTLSAGPMDGRFREMVWWKSAISSAQATALSANATARGLD